MPSAEYDAKFFPAAGIMDHLGSEKIIAQTDGKTKEQEPRVF